MSDLLECIATICGFLIGSGLLFYVLFRFKQITDHEMKTRKQDVELRERAVIALEKLAQK